MSGSLYNLLVVDDDSLIHQLFSSIVSSPWKMWSASSLETIPENIIFHAAFVDMNLVPNSPLAIGADVIAHLNRKQSQTEIVAMSGVLDRNVMELCLKNGAQKFIAKPLSIEEVQTTLDKILAHWQIRFIDKTQRGQLKARWIGSSTFSQNLLKKIALLKGETKSILIEGETGTGKEVIARLIHQQEPESPFIAVNSGSIPENLIESEMFGHIKGAFTGADSNRVGLAEAAHGGTLFLDEIEAMPLSFQAKLLRFLESGEIRRVGSKDIQRINVRVIAASNKDIKKMIQDGEFREDLYFRLNSHFFHVPNLRDHSDDIPELAQFFLDQEKPKSNKKFDKDAIDLLKKYRWPGNARELKRIVEQLSLNSPLPFIRKQDIEVLLNLSSITLSSSNSSNPVVRLGLSNDDVMLLAFEDFNAKIEKSFLLIRLEQNRYDIESTALSLKISKSNLYKKIKDYEIEIK